MNRRRNIVVWALVAMMCVHIAGTNLLYGIYILNKNVFIELFCENTESPELHCDGSCMISKMSKHNSEQSNKPISAENFQWETFVYIYESIELSDFIPALVESNFHLESPIPTHFIEDIFKPPILV